MGDVRAASEVKTPLSLGRFGASMSLVSPEIPSPIRSLPMATLASVLDQSVDCVKILGLDGRLEYMNFNGQCAMEIDDLSAIIGAD